MQRVIKLKKVRVKLPSDSETNYEQEQPELPGPEDDLPKWQVHQSKAEGFKLCARLKSDFEILKQTELHMAKEKDSWHGILPTKFGNLDIVNQFENQKLEKQASGK